MSIYQILCPFLCLCVRCFNDYKNVTWLMHYLDLALKLSSEYSALQVSCNFQSSSQGLYERVLVLYHSWAVTVLNKNSMIFL